MDGYSLRFRQPDGTPLPRIDVDPQVTDIAYQTGPGGFTVMSVGMVPGFNRPFAGTLDPPQLIPPFADCTLYTGVRPLFRGWAVEFDDDDPVMSTGVVVEGYGTGAAMENNWNRSTSTATSTSGAVLESILISGAPHLRIGKGDDWQNPGVSHTLNDFYKMTPGEVVDQLTQEGALDGSIVDFYVYEDLIARLIKRITPTQPEYRIPFDRRVRRNRNYRGAYGAATVEFGTSSFTLTVESYNEQFEREFGIQRFAFLPVGGLTSGSATSFRDTRLANAAGPAVAFTINRTDGEGMERWDGGVQPYELVRAGEWVGVGDAEPLPIVATTVDLTGRTLTVEVGAPSPHIPRNTNLKERDWLRKLARLISPLSGGRTR